VPQHSEDPLNSGIVLIDMSLHPIASDSGAASILSGQDSTPGSAKHGFSVPDQILELIRSRLPADSSSITIKFLIGRRQYRCRAYVVQSDYPSLPPAMIAVHFEADANGGDPIGDIASEYHLTKREGEAFRGIALGLTTKELADRMNISPNTVKAFVRLIMIKLGVASRSAIMLRLLQNHDAP
jgi:DNA-binding CsgD family transcriptional regulator